MKLKQYMSIQISSCDWLDDLITAVFISHTKILTSIGTNSNNSNIDLVIPKITTFIHKCYINIAREIWKNPYFFTKIQLLLNIKNIHNN